MTLVHLEGEVALNSLLKVIKCRCMTNCIMALCFCCKYSLHCLSACKLSHGTSYTNGGTEPINLLDIIDSDKFIDDDDTDFFNE